MVNHVSAVAQSVIARLTLVYCNVVLTCVLQLLLRLLLLELDHLVVRVLGRITQTARE